jgi:CheY-like chemotaxis protein
MLTGRRLRILLADNNPGHQQLAVHLLEECGHAVAVAHDGAAVRAALTGQLFDLVLLDLLLPQLNGFEAVAAIRKREQASGEHLPIVAVTTGAAGDRERCLRAGFDACLSRPLQAEELVEVLGRVTAGRGGLGPHRPAGPPAEEVLDAAAVLRRVDGDLELLREVIELFREDSPRLLAEIRAALADKDAVRLKKAAHTLKGSVGHIAAQAAFQAALELETLGGQGDLDTAEDLFARLQRELDRLQPALAVLAQEIAAG